MRECNALEKIVGLIAEGFNPNAWFSHTSKLNDQTEWQDRTFRFNLDFAHPSYKAAGEQSYEYKEQKQKLSQIVGDCVRDKTNKWSFVCYGSCFLQFSTTINFVLVHSSFRFYLTVPSTLNRKRAREAVEGQMERNDLEDFEWMTSGIESHPSTVCNRLEISLAPTR